MMKSNPMLAISLVKSGLVLAFVAGALVVGYLFRRNNPKKSQAIEDAVNKVVRK